MYSFHLTGEEVGLETLGFLPQSPSWDAVTDPNDPATRGESLTLDLALFTRLPCCARSLCTSTHTFRGSLWALESSGAF